MEPNSPMFEPGDQKVIGQGFSSPSSRKANRIYFLVMAGISLLGVGCFCIGEYLASAIMLPAG